MGRYLDIILFGATGYTGIYCIRALYNLTKSVTNDGCILTWGIAGRSRIKLQEALTKCQRDLGNGVSLQNVPILIADVTNYDSLKQMTASAKVVINCCGPYRLLGEPVIKACIETGTHQVDVTGEPEYMEKMQLKYNELAKEKEVYIINSCGFDSIPCDLGVLYLEKNFDGTLNSVESFMQITNDSVSSPFGLCNYATWESAIHGLGSIQELQKIRAGVKQKQLPKCLPKLQHRGTHQNINNYNQYVVPLPTSDRSVVMRTQRHLFENANKRPVQFENYLVIKTKKGMLLVIFFGTLIKILTYSHYGRKLLLQFPEIFSNGYFTRTEHLSEEKLEGTKIRIEMIGTGWDSKTEKLENDPYNFKELPNKTITGIIEGYNPSYRVASGAAVLAAIVLLLESDKLPSRGGVYTPGIALNKTSLIHQLQENNILSFKIKSKL